MKENADQQSLENRIVKLEERMEVHERTLEQALRLMVELVENENERLKRDGDA